MTIQKGIVTSINLNSQAASGEAGNVSYLLEGDREYFKMLFGTL
jgi:hypothetical protein